MTAYPMGTYFVEYVPSPNPDRAVWTGKIVVVRQVDDLVNQSIQ